MDRFYRFDIPRYVARFIRKLSEIRGCTSSDIIRDIIWRGGLLRDRGSGYGEDESKVYGGGVNVSKDDRC